MSIVTEVEFAHEDGALADTLATVPELTVSVVPEANTNPRQSVYLLRFHDATDEAVVDTVESDHTVAAAEPMPGFGSQLVLGGEFAADAKLLAPEVTQRDGIVVEAKSAEPVGGGDAAPGARGWHERWLLPGRETLHDLWEHARAADFDFEVLDFHEQGRTDPEYPGSDAPTDQQREALVTAYELGYFAESRDTSLEDVAAELDLSATAVAGRLKRGMRSLLGMTVAADRRRE